MKDEWTSEAGDNLINTLCILALLSDRITVQQYKPALRIHVCLHRALQSMTTTLDRTCSKGKSLFPTAAHQPSEGAATIPLSCVCRRSFWGISVRAPQWWQQWQPSEEVIFAEISGFSRKRNGLIWTSGRLTREMAKSCSWGGTIQAPVMGPPIWESVWQKRPWGFWGTWDEHVPVMCSCYEEGEMYLGLH